MLLVTVMTFTTLFAGETDTPMIPDDINLILGQISPDMAEVEVGRIVQEYYPDADRTTGSWSGQTGYVMFDLTPRYSISIAEYNDLNNFESRFVHADMIFYVYDWELKRRIDISFYLWDD